MNSEKFDKLFKIATVVSLQQINQSIQALGCSDIDKLNQKIENIELEIAKAKDAGSDAKNLRLLLDECLNVRQAYYDAVEREKREAKERERQRQKRKERFLLSMFIFSLIMLVIALIGQRCIAATEKSTVETIRCYNCKSTEVYGYAYFYYDDGTECSGSREYCLSHADYTLAQCHNCMRYQKITRE